MNFLEEKILDSYNRHIILDHSATQCGLSSFQVHFYDDKTLTGTVCTKYGSKICIENVCRSYKKLGGSYDNITELCICI